MTAAPMPINISYRPVRAPGRRGKALDKSAAAAMISAVSTWGPSPGSEKGSSVDRRQASNTAYRPLADEMGYADTILIDGKIVVGSGNSGASIPEILITSRSGILAD